VSAIRWIKRKLGGWRRGRRNFDAASQGRLTADWITAPLSADAAVNGRLGFIRDRSRDLERNNEWTRGFLRILDNNVLGERGITLQMRVRDQSGSLDEGANGIIEAAWKRWGRVGNCSLNRRHSWRDIQRLVLRAMARDGEVLIRKIRTRNGLRLQVIEADMLDLDYNVILEGGNRIRFGVETDPDTEEVVAYHILGSHPGDHMPDNNSNQRQRVEAQDMLHVFIEERPGQTRGVPWLVSSMKGLRMLDGYSEAELVAARTAASKMGFFTSKTGEEYSGPENGDGDLRMDAAPGTFEQLPTGVDFKSWDPSHPNSAFPDFVKARLRGVASSLGLSYNTLSSDLEGVNYSSIRAGLLEEREFWKVLQRFLIEHVCELVFSEWLSLELLRGSMPLPAAKLWKFDAPEFRGRRWPWVDPKKDIEANILGVRAGFTSQQQVVAESGGDITDVMDAQEADEKLAGKKGLEFPALREDLPAPPPPEPNADDD
jgi:lambda family phage portal protein